MSRVRIPANVDRQDRLVAGLTARQLVILAIAAVAAWLLVAAARAEGCRSPAAAAAA